MRVPVSGPQLTSLPREYRYISEVKYSPSRARFEPVQLSVTTGETYFDDGAERPVFFGGIVSDDTYFYYCHPRGLGVNDWKLHTCVTSVAMPIPAETIQAVSVDQYTRPSIVRTTTQTLVGYISSGNVVIRRLDTNNTLGTVALSVAHGLGPLPWISVSVINTNTFWIAWIQGNLHYFRAYINGVWQQAIVLTSHVSLQPWHATGARVVQVGSKYHLFYQNRDGAPVTRVYDGAVYSEPFEIMGADSEYAFQWAIVSGAVYKNNKLILAVSRAMENVDGELSAWYSTVMTSTGGLFWRDWSVITSDHFRGGVTPGGNYIFAATMQTLYRSPGSHYLGNGTWHVLDDVTSWTLELLPDSASLGKTDLVIEPATELPDAGDLLQRFITVNGTKYLLSTESVDQVPSSKSSSGTVGSIASRGLLKHGLDYATPVDQLFTSGANRLIDFTYHSVVSYSGVWEHDSTLKRMTMTGLESDGVRGLVYLPNYTTGYWWYISSAESRLVGSGPAFFIKDKDNYCRLVWTGSRYEIRQVRTGNTAGDLLGYFDALQNERPHWLIRYDKNVLYIYMSTSPSPPVGFEDSKWQLAYSLPMLVHPERSYIGWAGDIGSTLTGIYLRENRGVEFTVNMLLRAIAARAGMEIVVQDQENSVTSHQLSSTPLTFEKRFDEYDIYFRSGMWPGQSITLHFGGPSSTLGLVSPEEWVYGLKLDGSTMELYSSNDLEWSLLSSMPASTPMTNGTEVRVRISRSPDLKYSTLSVYYGNALMWTTPMPSHMDRGWLAITGTGGGMLHDLRVAGLATPMADHVWQYNRPATDEIRELLAPFFWSLYEQNDGVVYCAPGEYVRGSVNSVDLTTQVVEDVPEDTGWYSVFKVTGAELWGVYVDPALSKRGIRIFETSSPHLYDEEACLEMAWRRAQYQRSLFQTKTITGFLDPRMEPGVQVPIDGHNTVITRMTINVNNVREPAALMQCGARRIDV